MPKTTITGGKAILGELPGNIGMDGTVGMVLKTKEQFKAVLTAGHVVGAFGAPVYLPNSQGGRGLQIGSVLYNGTTNKGDDIALVKLRPGMEDKLAYRPWALIPTGDKGKTLEELAGIGDVPAVGTRVDISGALTGKHAMKVKVRSADWTSGEGKRFKGLMRLQVIKDMRDPLTPGDSGAPVYHEDQLIGIFVARDEDSGDAFCVPAKRFERLIAQDFSHDW